MKVLLIDDQEDVRRIARLGLSSVGGHVVVEADSGAAGLEKARAERPDVVLLDAVMPGLDGVSTLGSLRADPLTSGIPVVALSGSALEAEELLKHGAVGALPKPFDPVSLHSQLLAILRPTHPVAKGT